jgi:hypothetical protein
VGISAAAIWPKVGFPASHYVSSSVACCRLEIQDPAGPPDAYELVPSKEFRLWDLAKVLKHFNDPAVTAKIEAAPLEAIWKLQKVPLTSQLLAHYLRKLEGDGILFRSSKDVTQFNIALFFGFDHEVAAVLQAKAVSGP